MDNSVPLKPVVEVILSTYNSGSNLEELLESLLAQSYTNWKLTIRDDCSSDNSVRILKRYQKKDPERFHFIENEGINIGSKRSFEKLLRKSTSNYIMFCDHDDYWLSHKIEESLNKIMELESRTPNKAALVFTDLIITDNKLNEIHNSFWSFSKIRPSNIRNIYKFINNNPVLGCTVILNKEAKNIALPIPDQAIMHDWWLALKVSEKGVIDYIETPSILYRQHQDNEVGVERVNANYFLNRLLAISDTIRRDIEVYRMLKALDKKYSGLKMIAYKILVLFSKVF